MNKLKLNHTYLLHFGGETLLSATILGITNESYHIRWNNGFDSNDEWKTKEIINRNYSIHEDITNFIHEGNNEMVECHMCKGAGTIKHKKCPLCRGHTVIPKHV